MKTRRLIGIILMTFMLIVSQLFALGVPEFRFNASTQEVLITGNTQSLADVNIVIARAGKRYFLDTVRANEQGIYQFRSKLPKDYIFDVTVSSGDEVVNFKVETGEETPELVNKTALQKLIEEAKGKKQDHYTGASWQSFERALREAEAIYSDTQATQEQVNQVYEKLKSALNALVGVGGGVGPSPDQAYVTLSIDKLTINKGYVLQPTRVPFEVGETVWDVLKRELDQRGIDYDYTFTAQYNSVYVESIDGDGEFDHGPGSGWMYNVNGYYPEYGASLHTLSPEDHIEWRYTKNLGGDLGSNAAGGGGGGFLPGDKLEVPNIMEATVRVPEGDNKVFHINLTQQLDQLQSLQVKIPKSDSKVFLHVGDVKGRLPKLKADRTPFSLEINKGTQLISGPDQIGLFNPGDHEAIKALVSKEKLQDAQFYSMNQSNKLTQFSKPITLKMDKGMNRQMAWIVEDELIAIPVFESKAEADEKGQAQSAYAYKEGEDLIVSTTVLGSFVTYTAPQKEETSVTADYKDFDEISEWAKEAVVLATQKGIVNGYEGYFKPQDAVTRAAFTKMLLHAIYGEEIVASEASPFKDVNEEAWYKLYVDMAYEKGIVQGDGEYFKPNEVINREQMAVMIVRALGLDNEEQEMAIKDFEHISDWAKEDVKTTYSHGLINGIEGAFVPKGTATREMAVVVIMRAYMK
ncbi:MAG: S-layer homology domain-containing protein [Cellulosilyticaceae bacterium]